jgi:hypothetical protein
VTLGTFQMKTRKDPPKALRERIAREFNHRCAICGAPDPQFHHIDENPSNNDPLNLLPLCPNCHLTDHHNPTAPADPRKLRLFREHKDPTILSSQFHPLFNRLIFLDSISDSSDIGRLERSARELVEFVSSLKMGEFYAGQMSALITRPRRSGLTWPRETNARLRDAQRYRDQLRAKRTRIYSLAVELLRYQPWRRERGERSGAT